MKKQDRVYFVCKSKFITINDQRKENTPTELNHINQKVKKK